MKVVASTNKAEIFLYGYIGWDIKAQDFMTTLRQMEGKYKDIDLLINSGGGEMFEGLPLYNNLCSSPTNITADIQGLAASMITVVMCGAKKIRAASNAKIMIHGPRGGDFTTVEGLENIAKLMKDMRADMAKVYSKRTGKTEEWIIENWLKDGQDHWFSAQEAKEAGLIDEVYDAKSDATPQASWPLRRIAAFYDERLSLNNHLNQNEPSMKKLITIMNGSKLVTLPETATEELVAEGIQALVNQLSQHSTVVAQKNARIKELEDQALANQTASLKKNAEALIAGAKAAGKIVAAQEANLVALASASEEQYTNVKAFLESLTAYTPVAPQVTAAGASSGYTSMKDEFEKRAADGSLQQLKASNFEHFKAVYKAGTGSDFKG
jgi:ATP-dependent Clp endopeptidase proteolytic subunit ClpP